MESFTEYYLNQLGGKSKKNNKKSKKWKKYLVNLLKKKKSLSDAIKFTNKEISK